MTHSKGVGSVITSTVSTLNPMALCKVSNWDEGQGLKEFTWYGGNYFANLERDIG